MNQYKSNPEFYQSVFDEVHASDKLIMKVQNMTNNKTKKKIYAIRKVAFVAAAIIMVLVISNAVAYAATGATWIEHLVTATVNGSDYNAKLIDKYDENDELGSQELIIDYGNGIKEGIEYDGQYAIDSNSDIQIQIAEKDPRVVQESNRVFLSWMSADIHEDITEDFSDGHAEITVDDDDHNKMKFTVTGTVDKYKIVLSYRDHSVEFFSE